MVIGDIWPLTGVETFEDTFKEVGINPQSVLGLNDSEFLTFSLYPNPSNGSFSIRTPQSTRNAELAVYDLLGKVVHTQKLEIISAEVQVNIAREAYIVTVTSEEGFQHQN